MKTVKKSLVASACGVALVAGSALSAPIAGAQSGSLSPESLGPQCESATSDATLKLPAGDVEGRTGGVPADKGLVRVDGWGSADQANTRFGFATATELTNVTLTLELDEDLENVQDASIETPGAANVDEIFEEEVEGGVDVIDETFDEDTNTATVEIAKVDANSSLSVTYAATPSEGVTEVTNKMTVTADNLGEAGFCGEGIVGSIDDTLGGLPGGSLGNGSVADLVGSLSAISADEEDPEEPADA